MYTQANPKFIVTFATIHLARSPPMDQRLVLKIILSPFKTRKGKLKQNIGVKNCFVVLRFSEISTPKKKKKNDAKAVELRMQNEWRVFIS